MIPRDMVSNWRGKRLCTRSELEPLTGHSSHAAVVIKPGRIFLRHMFSLMARATFHHLYIHLDSVAKADLASLVALFPPRLAWGIIHG